MAKIDFELTDAKTGKSYGKFSWPVTPMTKIKESKVLTKSQKKKLEALIKDQIKMAKEHFKEGAWDLNSKYMLFDTIDGFFDFSFSDLFLTQMCYQAKVGYASTLKGSVYRNYTDKVFYNPVKNKIYLATTAKDVNVDIQLGDL